MRIVIPLFIIILLSCSSSKSQFIGKCNWENALEIAQNKFTKHNRLSDYKTDIQENYSSYQITFSPKEVISVDENGDSILHKGGGAKYVIAKSTCKIIDIEKYQ